MSDVVDILRAIVRDEMKSFRLGDLGVVTSAFPHKEANDDHNYECHVRLRETDVELRRVPMATPHVGMVSAPQVGELVLLSYVGGDANQPIIVGRLYSADHRPPIHETGVWRVESPLSEGVSISIDEHSTVALQSGTTKVSLNKDGSIELASEADVNLQVTGNVNLSCDSCSIDAAGNIELGKGGSPVITEASHKCYFSGAPLVGAQHVKAKK